MISHSPANTKAKPILVMTVGMDKRKQAVFSTAFRLHHTELYQLLDDNSQQPDLILIDADCSPGWHAVDMCRRQYPGVPLLALTAQPEGNAVQVEVLQKPIRVETLFPKLRTLLHQPTTAHTPAAHIEPQPEPRTVPAAQQPLKPQPVIQHIERFDPHSGLLGQVLRLYKQKQNVVIGDLKKPLFILLAEANVILLLQPLQQIRIACESTVDPLPEQSLPPEQQFLPGPRVKIQALLWQLALWSARGRLVLSITPDTPLRLRHWPNLTRLAHIPNASRLSAFLSRTPVSLRLTHRMLGIPLPHIIDFIAATYVIELLEDPGALQSAAPSMTITAPVARQQQSNMLSRLLHKIIGL